MPFCVRVERAGGGGGGGAIWGSFVLILNYKSVIFYIVFLYFC